MKTKRSDELPPNRMLISVYISLIGERWLELPTTATVADLRSELSCFTGVDFGRHVIRCWSKLQPTNETQLLALKPAAQCSTPEQSGSLRTSEKPAENLYQADVRVFDLDLTERLGYFFCRTLTGKTIELDYCGLDTVLDLKERIEEKEGIPADHLRLIYEGKQLEDGPSPCTA
jgi:hypothetical protein